MTGAAITRRNSRWYVKCKKLENEVDVDDCYASYMDANALNVKGHQCHKCDYGKFYRAKVADGVFDRSILDSKIGPVTGGGI